MVGAQKSQEMKTALLVNVNTIRPAVSAVTEVGILSAHSDRETEALSFLKNYEFLSKESL